MAEFDAVVVGAGVNGLTAAARLGRAGLKVLVLERADSVGGSARTRELLVPGVRHDVGAAVLPFAAASPAFAQLGLDVRYSHPPVALAHPFDDGTAAMLGRSVAETVGAMGRDAKRYRNFVERDVERFADLATDVLAPQMKWPEHPLLMRRFGSRAVKPATWLARRFREPATRALIAGIGAHATVPPTRPLTGGVAMMLLFAGHAVGWPVAVGGTQRVADALAAQIRGFGGTIQLGQHITSLSQIPPARALMLDLTPRQVSGLIPKSPHGHRFWKYGPGACKVDYVLSGPMPWAADACRLAGTIHLGGSMAEIVAAERFVQAGKRSERPYVLVAQPDVADHTRLHHNLRPLWAYTHVPHGSDADASPQIEAQFDRFAPGWRDLIVAKRVLTAEASEATNPNLVGGDIAGGLMSMRQMLLGPRPGHSPYRSGTEAVYLCSSSTAPGAGVHGMSGWHAAGVALEDLKIAEPSAAATAASTGVSARRGRASVSG